MLCFVIINSIVIDLFFKCVRISAVTGYAVEVALFVSAFFFQNHCYKSHTVSVSTLLTICRKFED